MKEATGTARIENQESLHVKILNCLGLLDVKVLPSSQERMMEYFWLFWCVWWGLYSVLYLITFERSTN